MTEIRHRHTGVILYKSETATTLRDVVIEAVASRANLRAADLRAANLSAADLRAANLRYADLSYADLRAADLSYADLSYANLRAADLRAANLRDANLSYANLRDANLRDANLSYANLRDANLRYANLSYANLRYANTAELTAAEYQIIRDEFRALFPDVPIVPNLDATICEIVNSGKGQLSMSNWHDPDCNTTHCRAGWAIHQAGEAGYALEAKLNGDSERAGGLIYRVSTGRIPNFFASNEDALADICAWGAKERESNGEISDPN